MPKVTKRFIGSDVARTVDLPTKAPAQTKKTKDKPPTMNPLMWLESKTGAKKRVSKVFPAIKLQITNDS